jgi:hypothetical protein
LIAAIRDGHPGFAASRADEILEELEDCLAKCQAARDGGLRVRLAVVP